MGAVDSGFQYFSRWAKSEIYFGMADINFLEKLTNLIK